MDTNGLKFWMLSEAQHFRLAGETPALHFDLDRRCLRLASQRRQLDFPGNESVANERLRRIPMAEDNYRNYAFWDESSASIMVSGAFDDFVEIYVPPLIDEGSDERSRPTDFAIGHDGIFYIAIDSTLIMQDKRERWDDVIITRENFNPWRIAAAADGGMWLLDRENKHLGLLQGQPLPRLVASRSPELSDQLSACQKNPAPPRIQILEQSLWPEDETPVALAANRHNDVVILSWNAEGSAFVRLLKRNIDTGVAVSEAIRLNGVRYPYSIKWHGSDNIAVLVVGATEAPVYSLVAAKPGASAEAESFTQSEPSSVWPNGELFPLKNHYSNGPFVHTLGQDAQYPILNNEENTLGSKTLRKLSFPFFATQGYAFQNIHRQLIDSTDPSMEWHRLFIEAIIPKGCGVRIWLAATDERRDPETLAANQWFEHRCGLQYQSQAKSDIPVAVWEPVASDIPHHPGFLPCDREKDIAGLFSLLIQRQNKKVRTLKGRYLHLHIELTGTGRTTPEIYALRAYGSRFSYVNNYLPELYHETISDSEADEDGASSPADFMGRFVGNFEGILTRIEDSIANAHRLTQPETTHKDGLDWLASWSGIEFDDALSEQQKRELIRLTPQLNRWRGTLRGFKLAIEKATQGGISGGDVVVLEDYKLRRTFATIIGADLDDENDPLTAGAAVSGNSYVGDTLFIGDLVGNKKEFLALFDQDLKVTATETKAVNQFFDQLSHRITILVHQQISPQDLGLIDRVARREVPAHVQYRILSASHPFLVGMASLVGVDTYLGLKPIFGKASINHSHISRNDFISGPTSLDPRIADRVSAGATRAIDLRPVAVAADVVENFSEDLVLDGSLSRAWPGRTIIEYRWSINDSS